MYVAEVFLPLKVCLEAAPNNITSAAVMQTVRACVAALGAKPYQARREAADALRVLAASVAASGPEHDAKRALTLHRDAVLSSLQVTSMKTSYSGLHCTAQMQTLKDTRHEKLDQALPRWFCCCLPSAPRFRLQATMVKGGVAAEKPV